MKSYIRTFILLACLSSFLNCGRHSDPETPPDRENPGNSNSSFNLIPGSDAFQKFSCTVEGEAVASDSPILSRMFSSIPSCPELALRQVGSAFSTHIIKMDVDADQNFYLLIEALEAGESQKFFGKFSLIKLDSSGKQIFEVKSSENNVFESFALHPSGEVTIVETRKVSDNDDPGTYHVWLRRLSNSGELKLETPLKDSTIAKTDNGSPHVLFYAGSVLLSNGEEVYLASATDKGKIYSLTANYQVKWSYQYLPTHRVIIAPGNSKLFLDKEGRLILGQTIHKQEILALETLFGESFPDKDGVLIYRFSSNGKDVEHKVITNSNAMDIAGIHADGDLITFGGDIHIKKFTEANHTYERDLIFFKFDISTGAILANKVIDLQRDDAASDFVIDHQGNGIIVGRNNYIQVDSHSVVDFGQAYILKVDPSGEIESYISFNGPRNTSLGSVMLQSRTDKTLFFSGTFDGPITHTGDHDPSLRYQKSMVGRLQL